MYGNKNDNIYNKVFWVVPIWISSYSYKITYLESSCETRKNVFSFTLKAPFVLKIIKFIFSSIQMSWYHLMPMHEAGNTFYWINWEVNTAW